MANFYGKNRDVDFAASKLMSFGKSFSRMNGQPLDESEVWYDKAALEAFAAGNSAYVGMKLVYVDETNQKVYQYSVQYDGTIKEIGVAPLGDAKSIVVDAETGTVSLKGISDLTFSREVDVIGEDGQSTGEKTTEEVKYQPLMTKDGLVWVEPSKTTVEGLATLIDALTLKVNANEAAIGVASKAESAEGSGDGVAATGLHKKIEDEAARAKVAEEALADRVSTLEEKEDKDTTYSVKENELVLKLEGTEFSTVLKIAHNDNKIQLLGINDAVISEFDASEFVADGVLEDAEYDAANKELVFTWNIITGEDEEGNKIYKTDRVNVGDLVDTYTAGNGITVENNVISAKVADDDKYLTVDATGIHTKGIDDAISAAEGRAAVDAQNKANAAQSAAEATAAADAAAKAQAVRNYVGEFTTGEDNYKDLDSVVAYINKKAEETLAAAQGGSSETAASVALALQNYKNENDPKVKANTDKLATIEEGAQVNVIETVKHSDTAKLTVTTNGKTVTVDDAELIRLINAAQSQADKGVQDAASAASAASAAQGTANQGVSDAAAAQAVADNAKAIADENKGAIAAHATEFAALKGRVDAHDTSKANAVDVYTKEQVNAITGTPDEGKTLVAMIAEKANATNVYNKSEVYTKEETNTEIKKVTDSIGTVPADSTVMAEIAKAQQAASYDDTEVRGLISGNTTAIENITKAEDGAIAVAVKAETDRATGVEQGLDERLQEVETFFAAVEAPDETIDTLAEIISYIESDKSGAAELTGKVNKNTEDISALTNRVIANETAISTTLPNAIAAAIKETEDYADAEIAKATPLASLIDVIEGETTTKTAKKGLILPEVDKFEMTDGKVTKISVDLLTNGENILVLNGGTAAN